MTCVSHSLSPGANVTLDAQASALAPVTLTDTIAHRGVTFTLDRPMPVCFSCLGDPAVISVEPFAVVAISPASALVSGASGSFVAHGTMRDPGDLADPEAQGFDGLIGSASSASLSVLTYAPAANIDPGATGQPIAFAQGETGSLVKSVRRPGVAEPDEWRTIDAYVVLSVLDAIPRAGFFRPGMAPGPKTVHGCEADVRFNVLRDLPSMSFSHDRTAAEAAIVHTGPFFGIGNQQKMRRLDVEGGSNYSRDYGMDRAQAHMFLHEDHSDGAKRLTFLRSIQHGIDLAQAQANGYNGEGGAGQNFGRVFFSYAAAFALNSPTLLVAAQAMGGGGIRQHFWVKQADVDRAVAFPASSGDDHRNQSAYMASDLDVPEWWRDPETGDFQEAAPTAKYRAMWPVGMMEALSVALLQNGPGGISGVEAILQEGPFDASNPFAAALAYYDRVRPQPTVFHEPQLWGTTVAEAWDMHRPMFNLPLWTGRPDWVAGDGQVVPGAGTGDLTYNWAAHTWATEAITRRDIRFSLDGLQWVETQGAAAFGTLSGLSAGLDHHVAFRLVSASGPGRWTPTYPGTGPSGENPNPRNVVTVPGSPAAAAPVNTVTPALLVREDADWPGSEMAPAPAVLTEDQVNTGLILYAGLGYWTGGPAPSFAYQWTRDGVDIAGATGPSYAPSFGADGGADLACRITADNGVAVSATTAPASIPAATVPNAFTPVANGGTAYLSKDLPLDGALDTKTGTFAFRGRILSAGNWNSLFRTGTGTSSDAIQIVRDGGNNRLLIRLRGNGLGQIFEYRINGVISPVATQTIVASWDLAAGTALCFVDGVANGTVIQTSDNPVYYERTNGTATFPSANGGSDAMSVEAEYLYLSTAFVDLTQAPNRTAFETPAGMGGDGSGPTGVQPLIYLTGDATSWNGGTANKGAGGAFAASGTWA